MFRPTSIRSLLKKTSPADFFQKEHLSGQEYADYLKVVVQHFNLEVLAGQRVQTVQPLKDTFVVKADGAAVTADCVIWASGEFSHAKMANLWAPSTVCIRVLSNHGKITRERMR